MVTAADYVSSKLDHYYYQSIAIFYKNICWTSSIIGGSGLWFVSQLLGAPKCKRGCMGVKVIHYQLVADDCTFRKLVWCAAKTPAEPLNQLLPLITVYLCVAYISLADKSRSFMKQSVFLLVLGLRFPQ